MSCGKSAVTCAGRVCDQEVSVACPPRAAVRKLVAPWLGLLFPKCHFTGNTSIRRDYKADKINLTCHFIELRFESAVIKLH